MSQQGDELGDELDWSKLTADVKPITEEWVRKMFGERCKEYVPGCPCCDRWELLDKLFADP